MSTNLLNLVNKKLYLSHNLLSFNECKTHLTYRWFHCLNGLNECKLKTKLNIKDKLLSDKTNINLMSFLVKFSSFNSNNNKFTSNLSLILNNNNNNNNNCLQLFERKFSQNSNSDNENDNNLSNRRPVLMHFKPKLWPNFWYKFNNFVTIHLIIRPYFDNDFTLDQFMSGSKQAFVYISNCLADGRLDSLKGLVTEEALREMRDNYSRLNSRQLEELRFQLEDIMYSFPYRIGIIMNDNNKRFVEITVVFYCLLKFQILSQKPEKLSFQEFKSKFGDQITVCNYRFICDYTKGVKSDWTVNLLGHFKNVDLS